VAGSAGNTGPACGTNNSPNNTPGAFNVGATSNTDLIAGFSSRGPNPFRNGTSPELSAPGVNVRSSVPGNGSAYSIFSGTSMSAPHVAGAVALLISLEPKLRGQIAQLEELLRRTADARPYPSQTCGGVPGSQAPNNTYGWGGSTSKPPPTSLPGRLAGRHGPRAPARWPTRSSPTAARATPAR
jgi:subtilisin family serine protease